MDSHTDTRNLMEELDISKFLVNKKENEDGPDIKGGHPEALIIHATIGTDKCNLFIFNSFFCH